jgi:hypothetical protein
MSLPEGDVFSQQDQSLLHLHCSLIPLAQRSRRTCCTTSSPDYIRRFRWLSPQPCQHSGSPGECCAGGGQVIQYPRKGGSAILPKSPDDPNLFCSNVSFIRLYANVGGEVELLDIWLLRIEESIVGGRGAAMPALSLLVLTLSTDGIRAG